MLMPCCRRSHRRASITGALAARLQREGAEAFSTSWRTLLARIEDKQALLAEANQ